MNLVDIEGPEDVLRGIRGIDGLDLSTHSAVRIDGGRWRVSGYATDAAVAELEARGASVTVRMTGAEVDSRVARLLRKRDTGEA